MFAATARIVTRHRRGRGRGAGRPRRAPGARCAREHVPGNRNNGNNMFREGQKKKLGVSPANLLINQGVNGHTTRAPPRVPQTRAGLEPETSGFSTLRINHMFQGTGTTGTTCSGGTGRGVCPAWRIPCRNYYIIVIVIVLCVCVCLCVCLWHTHPAPSTPDHQRIP